jgi:membrane protein YdbS with pleckstrin-like domain
MASKKEFRNELLKQNGLEPHGISAEDRQALQRILKRDRARARRMKWITAAAWALLLVAILIGGVSKRMQEDFGDYAIVAVLSLRLVAIVCTISLVVRSWIARNREFQFHHTEIEARLARVEEELKRLSQQD